MVVYALRLGNRRPLTLGQIRTMTVKNWPDGVRPYSINPTTTLDTPHIEATGHRRAPMMRETPKRYALSDSRPELDREIPKE